MRPGETLYDLLGVPKDASSEDIREAFFEAARRFHPDVNPAPDSGELFMRIKQAYEVLVNKEKRLQYDRYLEKSEIPSGVSVNVQYSVGNLSPLTQPQVVYSMLEINCTALREKSQPPPVHMCLVIDCSTSMQGERLDLVKNNVLQLIRSLRVQDILSVVTFNDRAEKLIADARGAEHKQAENQISLISASGGTEILKGLDAGMSLLNPTKGRATRLLVLITDGQTYGDEQACLELARNAAEDGVIIHAAGIGSEWNDNLLDQLAGITGGTSEFISRSKDLLRFFENQVDSMERLYARSIRLSGKMDQGVELRAVCRISPEAMVLPLENPIVFGPLLYGRPLFVLIEFLVRPIPRHYKFIHLFDGTIRADLVHTSINEEAVRVNIQREFGEALENYTPPKILVDAVAKYNLFRLQERARSELASGDAEQAARRLQSVATHLLAQGNNDMANMVINEVRNIQRTNAFSEEGDKRVKYSTRALMLPSGMEK